MRTVKAASVSEKRCRRCETVKPAEAFRSHPENRDGLAPYCAACTDALVRQGRKEGRYGDRGRRQSEAYAAAMAQLRERHRLEFEELYDVERVKRGLRAS